MYYTNVKEFYNNDNYEERDDAHLNVTDKTVNSSDWTNVGVLYSLLDLRVVLLASEVSYATELYGVRWRESCLNTLQLQR